MWSMLFITYAQGHVRQGLRWCEFLFRCSFVTTKAQRVCVYTPVFGIDSTVCTKEKAKSANNTRRKHTILSSGSDSVRGVEIKKYIIKYTVPTYFFASFCTPILHANTFLVPPKIHTLSTLSNWTRTWAKRKFMWARHRMQARFKFYTISSCSIVFLCSRAVPFRFVPHNFRQQHTRRQTTCEQSESYKKIEMTQET